MSVWQVTPEVWRRIYEQSGLRARGVSFEQFILRRWSLLGNLPPDCGGAVGVPVVNRRARRHSVPVKQVPGGRTPKGQDAVPQFLPDARIVLRYATLHGLGTLRVIVRIQHAFRLVGGKGPLVPFCSEDDRSDDVSDAALFRLSLYGWLLRQDPPAGFAGVPVTDWGVIQLGETGRPPLFTARRLLPEAEVATRLRQRAAGRSRGVAPAGRRNDGNTPEHAQSQSAGPEVRRRPKLLLIKGGVS